MLELIRESLSAHQLPITVLLGVVVLYWLMVVFGLVDLEGDVFELGDGVGDGGDGHVGGSTAMGGAWVTLGKWLGFTKVPIAVWGSFAVLFAWLAALILNYRFNGEPGARDVSRAVLLFVPSGLISLVVTKLVTLPVGKLFAAMADADREAVEVIGKVGHVVTGTVDERYGQIQLAGHASPLLLDVRVIPGALHLTKGDAARVKEASADGTWYFVETVTENPKPESIPIPN
jgi:hypothetical protein